MKSLDSRFTQRTGSIFSGDSTQDIASSRFTLAEEGDGQRERTRKPSFYWIGKDYANTYKGDFKDVGDFSRDQFNRREVPRMPWRDQALVMYGESARDLARHFILRWNQCKHEKARLMPMYPFLLPKEYPKKIEHDYAAKWFADQSFRCSIQVRFLRSFYVVVVSIQNKCNHISNLNKIKDD